MSEPLDFWNHPDWNGAEPFWMRPAKLPPGNPVKVGGVYNAALAASGQPASIRRFGGTRTIQA